VTAGYLQSRLTLPQNDNNDLGPLGNGLLGSPYTANTPLQGYLGFSPVISNQVQTNQDVDRVIGSATANWRPLAWLSGVAVAGVDYMGRYDAIFLPSGLVDPPDNRSQGYRASNPYSLWTYSANLSLTAVRDLTATLQSTTAIGMQYNR
jgi:hypothetical protein